MEYLSLKLYISILKVSATTSKLSIRYTYVYTKHINSNIVTILGRKRSVNGHEILPLGCAETFGKYDLYLSVIRYIMFFTVMYSFKRIYYWRKSASAKGAT